MPVGIFSVFRLIPRQKLPECPHAVCNSRFHGRRNADRTVNPTEVVVREMQGERGLKILPPLAEPVCQARQSPKLHPQGEVLALHMGCADSRPRFLLGEQRKFRTVPAAGPRTAFHNQCYPAFLGL